MPQSKILNYMIPGINYNSGRSYDLGKWRKMIIKRDNNRCQNCYGLVEDRLRNRKFSNEAHHIIPRSHGGRNTLNNGITLCRFCHNYFDVMSLQHGQYYFEIIKNKDKDVRIEEVKRLLRRRFLNFYKGLIRG